MVANDNVAPVTLADVARVAAMLGLQVGGHLFHPLPHEPRHVVQGFEVWGRDVLFRAQSLAEVRGFLADEFRRLVLDRRAGR